MMLSDYFRDELNFLKDEGKEFSKIYPHLTNFLSDGTTDPDVERLMEGFAFLTARLRQKIDDEFPELTYSILNLLWPNYLRPFPSCTIISFIPKDRATTHKQVFKKGAILESNPVDGVKCQYTTCADVPIYPLNIGKVEVSNSREKTVVALRLDTLSGQPLQNIECDELSIHLAGDDKDAMTCYLWLFNYLHSIKFVYKDEETIAEPDIIEREGFNPGEALLPYPGNVFDGYRVLQEFFTFPRRFYFFKLTQLNKYWPKDNNSEVTIELHFTRPMPDTISLGDKDFALHCAPAVNLFPHNAKPINLTGQETKYKLFPAVNEKYYEIFSIDKVTGSHIDNDTGAVKAERTYSPFETFQHEIERSKSRTALYYKVGIKEDINEKSYSHNISFVRGDEVEFFDNCTETISFNVTCTNRDLPEALAVGDICFPSQGAPSFVTFKNIVKPTKQVAPVLDGSLHWTLISNFSLNYLSLLRADLLKNVIRSYDFISMHDLQSQRHTTKRLNAISEIDTSPIDVLFKGFPTRGIKSKITIDGSQFICEGELFLFGTVLSHFFNLYSSINSFHTLEIYNSENSETYKWDAQLGKQPLI